MTTALPPLALLLASTAVHAQDPDRGLDPRLLEVRDAVLNVQDAWPLELAGLEVQRRLDELVGLWAEGRLEGATELPWVDVEACSSWTWTTSDVQRPWAVRRAVPEGERAALYDALALRRADLDGAAALDFAVESVRRDGAGLRTTVELEVRGRSSEGPVQEARRFELGWSRRGEQLVLASVEGLDAVSVTSPRPLFRDATAALLRDPALGEELTRGLDHWRERIPATLEPGFLGHQGLAVGDVDGDGLEDVYLCRPGGLPNRLLLHQPDGSVRDASAEYGVDFGDYSSSALLADLDGDRDLDLVVSTASALVVLENVDRRRYEQRFALERSVATSLAAADVEGDGDLDLYVCAYLSPYERDGLPVPYHDANNGERNLLLANDGAFGFADVTDEVGLEANNRRFSFAAAFEDYDDDGDPDLYVANDFGLNNLYRNDGGRFVDVAGDSGVEDMAAGMGVTWGDVDADGRMDLYVTNMDSCSGRRMTATDLDRPALEEYRRHARGNSLFLRGEDGSFDDVTLASGTGRGRWGWGGLFVDFDGDGGLDLLAPNGFVTGSREEDVGDGFWREVVLRSPSEPGPAGDAYSLGWSAINRLVRQGYSWNGRERNAAFASLGGGAFVDVSHVSGLDFADDSRAAARIDWDQDGDQDLLLTARSAPMVRLLENRSERSADWIAFELERAEHSPVGSRVIVTTSDGRRLHRALRCGEGYLAQSSHRLHFGTAGAEVERVEVRWSWGETEAFGAPAAGVAHRLEEGTGRAVALARPEHELPSAAAAGRPDERPDERLAEPATRTTLLVPSWPVPALSLETPDGRAASLLGIGAQGPRGLGRPLAIVLWDSRDARCRRELEEIAGASAELRGQGLELLAVAVDGPDARDRLDDDLAFAQALASDEAALLLEVLNAHLLDHARALDLPACMLIDPAGRWVATQRGDLDPRTWLPTFERAEASTAAVRDAATPYPCRWIAPPPDVPFASLTAALAARGLERSAAELELARVEMNQLTRPQFEYEKAMARIRQGNMVDAARILAPIAEADPTWFDAHFALAFALERTGRSEEALDAYERAVGLEPRNGRVRFNLGLLLVTLDRHDEARQQADALRSVDEDLASKLLELVDGDEQ